MPGFGDLVQKAFYLGVGLAATAGEKAGGNLAELRVQAQQLADELVAKGEITTKEARKLVDDMVTQAQQQQTGTTPPPNKPPAPPRQIEIIEEEESTSSSDQEVEQLRQKVQSMQEELRQLERD